MNEVFLLALGAVFSLFSTIASSTVFFFLRSLREEFHEMARKIELVDAKANENREAIARLEGRFGNLGSQQNWRE